MIKFGCYWMLIDKFDPTEHFCLSSELFYLTMNDKNSKGNKWIRNKPAWNKSGFEDGQ